MILPDHSHHDAPHPAGEAIGGSSAKPPPSGGTSLDPIESSVNRADIDSLVELPPLEGYQRHLHSSWEDARRRTYRSLVRTSQSASRRRAFAGCGQCAWVYGDGPTDDDLQHFRVAAERCHDRLCTPCAIARAWDIRTGLVEELAGREVKFITLTLRTMPDEALSQCIDRLYLAFRAMRRTPLWISSVRGGAAFLEITRGSATKSLGRAAPGCGAAAVAQPDSASGHWHTHLHVICDAKYIPVSELGLAWSVASRGSYIVNIQRAAGGGAANYVTKYVTKALSGPVSRDEMILDEFVVALRGRRLCLTFGSWYGKSKLASIEQEPEAMPQAKPVNWRSVGAYSLVYAAALRGESIALRAITYLRIALRPAATGPPV